MDDIAKKISDALGLECVDVIDDGTDEKLHRGLSLLTSASFDFSRVETLGENLLLARPRQDMAPRVLLRLLDEVAATSQDTVVCSLSTVTPYLRKVLLSKRRGFVTDDGQAYVPGLLRLVPKIEPARSLSPRPWGPAERLAFVYLLQRMGDGVTSADLVAATALSATSATRALARVAESAGLDRAAGGRTGRAAVWHVSNPEAFVERGTRAFGEAIRRRILVADEGVQYLPLAGTSALARRSMLASPAIAQRACSVGAASSLVALREPPAPGVTACEVLVLSYNPLPVAAEGLVDLYTMLRTVDRSDERVDSAAEDATEGYPWLKLV